MIVTIQSHEYDLTEFVHQHPGGSQVFDILQKRGGDDLTPLVYVYHSNPKQIINDILPKYRLRRFETMNDVSKKKEYSYDLYLQLRTRVYDHIKNTKLNTSYDMYDWTLHAFMFIVYICTWVHYCHRPTWPSTILLVMMIAWWGSNIAHEMSHHVNGKSPSYVRIIGIGKYRLSLYGYESMVL